MNLSNRTALVALLAAGALAAGCGGDDPDTTAATPTATATATAGAEATATAKPRKDKPRKDRKPRKDKPAKEQEAGPKASATPFVLPSSTPEPGPPVEFGATVTASGIEPTLDEIPPGKSLVVTIRSEVDKPIQVGLEANGVPVGFLSIAPPEDEIFVQVRNLDPGKLVFKSGKKRATVRVREGA